MTPDTHQPIPSGNEAPRPGCVFDNSYNVCSYGTADFRQVYQQHRELLGTPISAVDASQCQTFVMAKLCYDPGAPPGWEVQLANLGLDDLTRNGFLPQPGSEQHPAVRDFLAGQQQAGVDIVRVYGRVLSPPICDAISATCRQFMDKTVLVFDKQAVSGVQVQRLPLGLQSLPAPVPTATAIVQPQPVQPVQPAAIQPPIGGLAIGALIAALLIAAFFTSRRPPSTTPPSRTN